MAVKTIRMIVFITIKVTIRYSNSISNSTNNNSTNVIVVVALRTIAIRLVG